MEEYVNNPHIKKVIKPLLAPDQVNNQVVGKVQHGKIIHGSISGNPNNMVRGPAPQRRDDDPGMYLDRSLLQVQSDTFKTAVKPFDNQNTTEKPTLQEFGNIPPACPVVFEQRGDKFGVKEAHEP